MTSSVSHTRVVVVADSGAARRLGFEADGSELLLRSDVVVVPFPPPEDTELVTVLDRQGLLRPGAMLVQSPYDPRRFAPAEDAADRFALEKLFAFSTLAGHLGAKLVEVEQTEVKVTSRERASEVTARNPARAEASLNLKQDLEDRVKREFKSQDQFVGGAPDFEAAERLLDDKRLRGDWNLVSLVEARRSRNQITERTVTLILTEESNANLSIAASLRVPTYLRLNAQASEALKRKIEYRLTLRVVF